MARLSPRAKVVGSCKRIVWPSQGRDVSVVSALKEHPGVGGRQMEVRSPTATGELERSAEVKQLREITFLDLLFR
jgi:hypothetical protein